MGIVKAIYPGTFDPVTNGHIDIIERAARLFSEVVVAVAASSSKKPHFELSKRETMLKQALRDISNVSVVSFEGLLTHFVKTQNTKIVIRGLRAVSDFEYEFQLAAMNRSLDSELETVFLTPSENAMFVSSSLVREIALMGGDISSFVPENVVNAFKNS